LVSDFAWFAFLGVACGDTQPGVGNAFGVGGQRALLETVPSGIVT
jgi:hypothetical protein